MIRRIATAWLILLVGLIASQAAHAAQFNMKKLIPAPRLVLTCGEVFPVQQERLYLSSSAFADARLFRALNTLMEELELSYTDDQAQGFSMRIMGEEVFQENVRGKLQSQAADFLRPNVGAYYLSIDPGEGITIASDTARGAFYAIKTVEQVLFLTKGRLAQLELFDAPVLERRGVLEGYYGRPWTLEEHQSMIEFEAAVKFNVHVYSPKDEAHLTNWRTTLDRAELDVIRELVARCSENFITFSYSLSPGRGLTYSSDDDLQTVADIFIRAGRVGVRSFGLQFDDIRPQLNQADSAVYESFAAAQVDFANKLLSRVKKKLPDATFGLTPTQYSGPRDNAFSYLHYLGQHISEEYEIGWTGPGVTNTYIVPEDVRKFVRWLGRKPLLGDNFPVADRITSGGPLHLSPLRGRDPRIVSLVTGYVANAMPLPEASKIGLATAADFTWNPHGYVENRSWRNSVRIVAGLGAYAPFTFFGSFSQSFLSWARPPDELDLALKRFWYEYDRDESVDVEGALQNYFTRFASVESELDENLANRALFREIRPWTTKLRQLGIAGLSAIQVLRDSVEYSDSLYSSKQSFLLTVDQAEANKAGICGGLMEAFFERVTKEISEAPY